MRSLPEAVAPPTVRADEASSSVSSEEVSAMFEEDAPADSSAGAAIPLSNGGGGGNSSVHTLPPEILNPRKLELPAGLERSKTERQIRNNILAEEAAQIFYERISVMNLQAQLAYLKVQAAQCIKNSLNYNITVNPNDDHNWLENNNQGIILPHLDAIHFGSSNDSGPNTPYLMNLYAKYEHSCFQEGNASFGSMEMQYSNEQRQWP
ncbi:hypothetical protein OROMI_015890 [Orobanche minor]